MYDIKFYVLEMGGAIALSLIGGYSPEPPRTK